MGRLVGPLKKALRGGEPLDLGPKSPWEAMATTTTYSSNSIVEITLGYSSNYACGLEGRRRAPNVPQLVRRSCSPS